MDFVPILTIPETPWSREKWDFLRGDLQDGDTAAHVTPHSAFHSVAPGRNPLAFIFSAGQCPLVSPPL